MAERAAIVRGTGQTEKCSNGGHWYALVWRWHFYAGLIFSPVIILLAVTGAVYLFKPQLEEWLYRDLMHVSPGERKMAPSDLLETVKQANPDAVITAFTPSFGPDRAAEVMLLKGETAFTVFVDPYSGKIQGTRNESDRLMNRVEKLHGELMAGTAGDRIVELAACWALILVATGLYLWWPREKRRAVFGTLLPRFAVNKRVLWRDLHAALAFWLSAGIVALVLTGLPWSGFTGEWISRLAAETGTGYPKYLWDGKPESTVPTREVADVPWAAETLPVPFSASGNRPISLEQVMNIAEANRVKQGYVIHLPEGEKGVYTVSLRADRPEDEATLHLDQYSGKVLADLRFGDYGPLAQAISIGIALHEGRYFGLWNQLLGLLICLGLIFLAVSGWIMWWKRRPAGRLGVPPKPASSSRMKGAVVWLVVMGLLFPLVGASLLLAFAVDRWVVTRVPVLAKWLR